MKGKRCRYCKSLFIPDPRVGERQKTSGDPLCQKAHKAENNARWRKRNPGYFCNDYPMVKQWLDHHPGYLKQYRDAHPEYVKKNREARRLRYRRKKLRVDIQAEICIQPLEITFLFSALPCLDIQATIDNAICLRDNAAIHAER